MKQTDLGPATLEDFSGTLIQGIGCSEVKDAGNGYGVLWGGIFQPEQYFPDGIDGVFRYTGPVIGVLGKFRGTGPVSTNPPDFGTSGDQLSFSGTMRPQQV